MGAYELPLLYCVGCTLLQGFFCLGEPIFTSMKMRSVTHSLSPKGIIWRMDPYRMPNGFCIGMHPSIHAIDSIVRSPSPSSTIDFHWIRNIPNIWSGCSVFCSYKFSCAEAQNLGRSRKVVCVPLDLSANPFSQEPVCTTAPSFGGTFISSQSECFPSWLQLFKLDSQSVFVVKSNEKLIFIVTILALQYGRTDHNSIFYVSWLRLSNPGLDS